MLSPGYWDLRTGLARTRLRQGRAEDARNLACGVLDKAPTDVDALLVAGLACQRLGDIGKAREYLERGVRLADAYAHFHVALGNMAEQDADVVQARAHYRRVIELDKSNSEAAQRLDSLERYTHEEARAFGNTGGVCSFQLAGLCLLPLAYLPFTYHQIHRGPDRLGGQLRAFPSLVEPCSYGMRGSSYCRSVAAWRPEPARGGRIRDLSTGLRNRAVDSSRADATGEQFQQPMLGGDGTRSARLTRRDGHIHLRRPRPMGRSHGRARRVSSCGGVALWSFHPTLLRRYGSQALAVASSFSRCSRLGIEHPDSPRVFLGVFLALECVTSLASLFKGPAKLEFLLCHLLLAGTITYLTRAVIWPALGFEGWEAAVFAIAVGIVLAATNAGTALWLAAESPVNDGIAATASPATLGRCVSARSGAVALLSVGFTGWWLTAKLEAEDWNHLLQKLTACAVWLATYACFYLIAARSSRAQKLRWLAGPLILLCAYKGVQASAPSSNPALEFWAERDASLQLARQLLSPVAHEAGEFFQFLNKNTNIAATVHVEPVPIEPAEGPTSHKGPRPNIFIFTIDSLRRDYLGPYNHAVSFTPEIARFAQESAVFENAFTRYGGTGLSEPAIWSGAMLLHKQYITPFGPMNALEKLVNAEGYQKLLSRDSILDELLRLRPRLWTSTRSGAP